MITADAKEPKKFRKLAGRTENLEVVDYLVEGEHRRYAIERKTVSDLVNSRNDGRLWKQLEALAAFRDSGYIPMLVVVGNWGMLFRMKRIRLVDFLSIQVAVTAYGVGVVHLPNERFFTAFLKYLDEKVGRPVSYKPLSIPKPRERSIEDERRDMLMAVSGVGYKTAEELLRVFGTIRSVVNAEAEKLERVLGKRVRHFLEVIG